MPTVPTYGSRKVQATALPSARRQAASTPQSEGAGIGQAMAQAGDTIARVGGALLNEVQRVEHEKADRLALTTAQRQLGELEHLLLNAPDKGALTTVKGKDTIPLRQTVLESYDIQTGEIEKALTNDRQRAAFATLKEERRRSMLGQVDAHTVREMTAYEKNEATASIVTAVNLAIANASNPVRVAEELNTITRTAEQHAGALGLTGPEAKALFIKEWRSKVHEGVVTRLLTGGNDRAARAYFDEVKDQISGDAVGALEAKVTETSSELLALRVSEEIWAAHAPVGDNGAINLDAMEAEVRKRFIDDPRTLKATIGYLRERKQGVDSSRKERDDARGDAIWTAVFNRQPMSTIARMPEFIEADGATKERIRAFYQREAEHTASLAYQAEAREAARESRRVSALARAEREQEIRTWSTYATMADPERLRTMSRADILAKLPELGRDNTARLLTDHEQLQRSDAVVRAATIDRDLFLTTALDAGIDYAYNPKQSETEKATLGRLEATVKERIGQEQQRLNRPLSPDEKRALMESIVDQKVMISEWGFDSPVVAAGVTPESRRAAYVPLAQIDPKDRRYQEALNYLRGLPGNAGLAESALRSKYRGRIEKAVGRSLTGGTREEIENALKGLN
jgi:hypothetical protein